MGGDGGAVHRFAGGESFQNEQSESALENIVFLGHT
jgi:hypothetical protein